MDLKDKVAIVTGASRGIGKAIALGLAGEGVKVVVAARSESPRPGLPGTIHATVEAIQAIGGTALAVACNVREEESILAMVRQTMDAFGRVDVLVNNAGIGSYRSLLESSVKEWDLVMDIDLRAPFICCQAVVPHMIDQGATRDELMDNLRSALKEALKMNRADAVAAVKGEYEEVSLEV